MVLLFAKSDLTLPVDQNIIHLQSLNILSNVSERFSRVKRTVHIALSKPCTLSDAVGMDVWWLTNHQQCGEVAWSLETGGSSLGKTTLWGSYCASCDIQNDRWCADSLSFHRYEAGGVKWRKGWGSQLLAVLCSLSLCHAALSSPGKRVWKRAFFLVFLSDISSLFTVWAPNPISVSPNIVRIMIDHFDILKSVFLNGGFKHLYKSSSNFTCGWQGKIILLKC